MSGEKVEIMRPMLLSASEGKQPLKYIPRFVYGTAWKKERSADLVVQAVRAGFTGIDTAAQPKHYEEKLVGDGIRKTLAEGKISRKGLYIQTKFTPPSGQDPRNLPYSLSSPIQTQIQSSIASSLHNFHLSDYTTTEETSSYIDTLVLHSPLSTLQETLTAWHTFETYVPKSIHYLGISNTTLPILSALYDASTIKPAVVQNRFYPGTHYDGTLRKYCKEKGIVYQTFWTLTGNPQLMRENVVQEVSKSLELEREVALYLLVMGLGDISVLNGTTNEGRMKADLDGLRIWILWSERPDNRERWGGWMKTFRGLIGDEVDT